MAAVLVGTRGAVRVMAVFGGVCVSASQAAAP